MKKYKNHLFVMALAVVLAGCSRGTDTSPVSSSDSITTATNRDYQARETVTPDTTGRQPTRDVVADPNVIPPQDRITPAVSNLNQQARDTINTAETSLAQARDEFINAADKRLQDLQGRIDEVSDRVNNLSGDAKDQAQATLNNIREQREAAIKRMEEARGTTQENWDAAKSGLAQTLESIEKSLEDLRARLQQ